jgi:coenzyme PQQ biosynthesis protein PqqD
VIVALEDIPQLARGCRVQTRSEEETVLMVPEGLLRLKGAGAEILVLVDGESSAAQIIARLQSEYPSEAPEQIAGEVVSFLTSLNQRSVLLFKKP